MVVLTVSAVIFESTAWAQPKTQPQSLEKPLGIPASISEDISLDQLKTKRVAVEGAAGLDATNKKNVLNLLDKAIQLRELADKINRQRDETSQTIIRAPDRLKKIQSEIDQTISASDAIEIAASTISSLQLEIKLYELQEIVANFICGMIVLFERPFRVGDTVTIGETSGTVSRIRIRATTITDWDRRELIVPNKEFSSFPQRDVHLDASSPLEIRVVSSTNRE